MLEWYLHAKTQLPDDPLQIARQCNFGQDQLAKVNDLVPEDQNKADQETGRPAFYDNATATEYQHSIGTRKGPPNKLDKHSPIRPSCLQLRHEHLDSSFSQHLKKTNI